MSLIPLLHACLNPRDVASVLAQTEILPTDLSINREDQRVGRVVIAHAMNLVLFYELIGRVPAAHEYVRDDVLAKGRRVVFDHGAIRTVAWPCGALPAGEAAFTRVLEPLGFRLAGVYPLPRLKMTGRAYCHQDAPETIAQFFVSELHPELFSPEFRSAVSRVVGASFDPLSARDRADLAQLASDGELPLPNAVRLLPALVRCFERQHDVFDVADYETLRSESVEMAWIATEGNAFNHATDRVDDVAAVAEAQRRRGRPIKETVEVSGSGRVRQTAFHAHKVDRVFLDSSGYVLREVPGSFYEFITRDPLPDTGATVRLDLAFDSANATGIFAMTANRERALQP